MRIALFEPDIPQNTGTILRLAACLGLEAHIIEPAGFATSDRAFRRAGMDYLDQVELVRHPSWEAFEAWRGGAGARLFLFTTRAHRSYLAHAFRCGKDCARSMWRWPPPWRWVKRCDKPRRPPTARANAARQTPSDKSDYGANLKAAEKIRSG